MAAWIQTMQSKWRGLSLWRWICQPKLSKRHQFVHSLAASPERPALARTNEDWRRLRKRTCAEVKKNLEKTAYTPAIRLLTRALLEDPACPLYLDLLRQAVALKRRRKAGSDRGDRWSGYSPELQQAALQLEALIAYAHEAEGLFAKAALVSHAPVPPRGSKP